MSHWLELGHMASLSARESGGWDGGMGKPIDFLNNEGRGGEGKVDIG